MPDTPPTRTVTVALLDTDTLDLLDTVDVLESNRPLDSMLTREQRRAIRESKRAMRDAMRMFRALGHRVHVGDLNNALAGWL